MAAPSLGTAPQGMAPSMCPQSPRTPGAVLTCSYRGRLGCPSGHPHGLGPRALLLLLLLLVELEGWERWSEPPIMASCLPLGQQGGGLPAQDTPPRPQRSGRRGDMASVTLATVPRP